MHVRCMFKFHNGIIIKPLENNILGLENRTNFTARFSYMSTSSKDVYWLEKKSSVVLFNEERIRSVGQTKRINGWGSLSS